MDVQEIIRTLLLPASAGARAPTQAEVAAQLGVTQSTLSKWLRGSSSPNFRQAEMLREVAISRGILSEVRHGFAASRVVAIVGAVGLGEDIEWFPQGEGVALEEIELPFPVSDGCFALEARGNSMHPRVKNGELIVARSNGYSPEEMIGEECVLKVKGGPYLFKTLRRGYVPNRYNLESFNGEPRENVEIEWVGELWAILPKNRWSRVS